MTTMWPQRNASYAKPSFHDRYAVLQTLCNQQNTCPHSPVLNLRSSMPLRSPCCRTRLAVGSCSARLERVDGIVRTIMTCVLYLCRELQQCSGVYLHMMLRLAFFRKDLKKLYWLSRNGQAATSRRPLQASLRLNM